MWYVVWISCNDSKFHACKGFDEVTARKTAGLLIESKGLRRSDNHELIDGLRTLAEAVRDSVEIYRDVDVANPFHCTDQTWVVQASTLKKARSRARGLWIRSQLQEGSKESNV